MSFPSKRKKGKGSFDLVRFGGQVGGAILRITWKAFLLTSWTLFRITESASKMFREAIEDLLK